MVLVGERRVKREKGEEEKRAKKGEVGIKRKKWG